jgi:hypothetical protein
MTFQNEKVLSLSVPAASLQAGLLIGVAGVAGILHLGAVAIAVVMAAALAAVVGAEWVAMGERQPGLERAAEPTHEPGPPIDAPLPPAIAPPVAARRRLNVFDLQGRARSIVGRDPARDEELSFLLLYPREFADISGDLSEDVDTFVRESLPELVGE